MLDINLSVIENAIINLDVSPTAKEAGANLVEAWIQQHYAEDSLLRILAVECGFVLWLDKKTLVIGVQDLIAEDSIGPFGNEWKSTKEPKKNKDGRDSAWWNEQVWLQEISNGPQLAIYALAMNQGVYFEKSKDSDSIPAPLSFNHGTHSHNSSRIRVRAAVKSSPVRFWPENSGSGVYEFDRGTLEDIAQGVRAKAEQIRCARKSGLTPWQLTGKHCFPYGRECPLFADWCSKHVHPQDVPYANLALFDAGDPAASLSLPYIKDTDLNDPELVILSASSYTTASNCLELYRVTSQMLGGKEESINLDIGTAMHAGLAEYYRELKRVQIT